MNVIKERAYAKINLFLDVLKIRDDGFHEIKSVMHTVSLADDLLVYAKEGKTNSVKISIDGSETSQYLPLDDRNLCAKAAYAFAKRLGIPLEVTISLNKKIPIGAGLGGGSADAAATLRGLNKIFKRPFSEKALCDIALTVGSDVPFCVVGKTSLCEGRGEIITPISKKMELKAVIANSGEYVSTPQAYAGLDEAFSRFDGTVNTGGEERFFAFMNADDKIQSLKNGVFNIFENVILDKCPKAHYIKEKFEKSGAFCSLMSGSGPSVFALYDDIEKADAFAQKLREEGFFACSVTSAE